MKKLLIAASLVMAACFASQICIAQDSLAINSEDRIFTKVDVEASFKGGLTAWAKFLQENLKPNVPIKKGALPGTYVVIIKFVVDKNGKVRDIEAETNNGYGTEVEAIRVIRKSPDWKPALQNGKPVNAYRRQPIVFQVDK